MRRTPMLRVAAGMAVGILLAEYLAIPAAVLWTALGIGAVLLFAGAFMRRRWPSALVVASLWAALVSSGGLIVQLHTPDNPFAGLDNTPGPTLMQLRLTDTPHSAKNGYKVPVAVEAYVDDGRWCATQGGLMLFLPPDSTVEALHYGQRLVVRGTPRRPSGEENPGQFNYQRYLRHRGVLWQCRLPEGGWVVTSTGKEVSAGVTTWAKQLQWTLVQRIRNSQLTPSQQGIAEAMLLGWRDDTDMQTTRQFREAGIAHLLCVSGLHVGIVALLVRSLLFFLGRRRWQRAVKGAVQTLAVWLFVCLTGLSPSALRAGVMFTLLIAGDALAQRPNSANNLATSAVLLLCLRPMLLFDVGFQLSYAAVAGIIIGYKPIYQLITPPLSDNWLAASMGTMEADMPLHRGPAGHPAADAILLPSIPSIFPYRQHPYRAFRQPVAGHNAGHGGQLRVAMAV